MKGLDLSVFNNDTWEITLSDARKININKPSQSQLIVLESIEKELVKTEGAKERLDLVNKALVVILNNNKEDIRFEVDDLSEWTIDMVYAVYFGYREFINEVMSNPN